MSKIVVTLDEIEQKTIQCLTAHGADQWIAQEVGSAVRYAEARNNPVCGLYYLESYCTHLRNGRVNGTAQPVVTQPRGSAVEVDAKMGFAQSAFSKGIDKAIDLAKTNGTCSL